MEHASCRDSQRVASACTIRIQQRYSREPCRSERPRLEVQGNFGSALLVQSQQRPCWPAETQYAAHSSKPRVTDGIRCGVTMLELADSDQQHTGQRDMYHALKRADYDSTPLQQVLSTTKAPAGLTAVLSQTGHVCMELLCDHAREPNGSSTWARPRFVDLCRRAGVRSVTEVASGGVHARAGPGTKLPFGHVAERRRLVPASAFSTLFGRLERVFPVLYSRPHRGLQRPGAFKLPWPRELSQPNPS
jgi:hypothetical protein